MQTISVKKQMLESYILTNEILRGITNVPVKVSSWRDVQEESGLRKNARNVSRLETIAQSGIVGMSLDPGPILDPLRFQSRKVPRKLQQALRKWFLLQLTHLSRKRSLRPRKLHQPP